jgi:hypothetical protein
MAGKERNQVKRVFFIMIGATALLTLLAGCATTTTTSTHDEERSMLVASGFKMVTPKTAAQHEKLQHLQTGQVAMIHKEGKAYYIVADPSRNVVYVGGPTEYQAYQHLRAQRHLAQETAETEEMYEDEAMDWGGWGGWGLGWGRMGYGPRVGRVGIY